MKNLYIAVMLPLILVFSGCTQNDGHIGPIFGSWALDEIAMDGAPVEMQDETVFSFQNELVQVIRLLEPPYSLETRYGNFTLSDKTLVLKFQDKPTESGSYIYTTPFWLEFPEGLSTLRFDILDLKGSKMELALYIDGKRLTYKFRKTW